MLAGQRSDYVAVVFAEERERWRPQSRFIAAGNPNQGGRFTITGSPPGRYLAAAVPFLERGEEQDPDVLARLETSAMSRTLGEGSPGGQSPYNSVKLQTAEFRVQIVSDFEVPIDGGRKMRGIRLLTSTGLAIATACAALFGQTPARPDWKALEAETLNHFQSLVRIQTMDPPGGEEAAAKYLVQALQKDGIPAQTFTLEPGRTNVVARLKGNGKRRPLLLMGHTDTVNVDPAKWTFPPFSAARDSGYIYGRGTLDDKDNVTASLMTMLLLKRLNVPLDRDVIFLAEAGEEGPTRVGIQFMVNQHFGEIEAEYCLAEGGGVSRVGGRAKYASVQTLEKIPRAIELTVRGVAGHGSVPLKTNPIVNRRPQCSPLHRGSRRFESTRRPERTSDGSQTSRRPRRRSGILPLSAWTRK